MLVYGKCVCFVMQILYLCVLCASCDSPQCCVLHDCLLGRHYVSFCLPHLVAVITFIICRGLWACTEML